MRIVTIKRHTGEPVQAGGVRITPVSRSFTLKPPGGGAAVLSWVRPEAIRVSMGGGPERTMPLPDRTRRAQLLTVSLHLATLLLATKMIKLISRRKR